MSLPWTGRWRRRRRRRATRAEDPKYSRRRSSALENLSRLSLDPVMLALFGSSLADQSSCATRHCSLMRILTRVYLVVAWMVFLLVSPAAGTDLDQVAPILAHPTNPVNIDRRFGIPIEPGIELFTGDVITFSMVGVDPESGQVLPHRLLKTMENGEIYCAQPTLIRVVRPRNQGPGQGGYAPSPPSPSYVANGPPPGMWAPPKSGGIGNYSPYGGPGYGPAGYSPNAYGNTAYGGSKYYRQDGDDELEEEIIWIPQLDEMFVVNVIDGRLGMFSLNPVITLLDKPRYFGPISASGAFRSGVAGSVIGESVFTSEDAIGLAYWVPLAEPFLMTVNPVGLNEVANNVGFRPSPRHGHATCTWGPLMSTFTPFEFFDTSALQPSQAFHIDRIPAGAVRRMLDRYQAMISGRLPRTFIIFSSLPFVDRVEGIHFHGADAQLTARDLLLGKMRMGTRGTRLEQQTTLSMRMRATDNVRFSFDIGFLAELELLLDFWSFDEIAAGVNPDIIIDQAVTVAGLVDFVNLIGTLRLNWGYDIDLGSYIEFSADSTLMCPSNMEVIGHIARHIGFTSIPFSMDVIRQEFFWPGQWIADMQLDPRELVRESEFNDPCLFGNLMFTDPTIWISRFSHRTENVWSILNPFGLVHPAFQLDHFLVTGEYEAAHTQFLEWIVERML